MKKSRKVLSLVLALALAFSAIGTVFAVSAASETTYTPTYTAMSKEDVEVLVKDLDVMVNTKVFDDLLGSFMNGDTIEMIYELYPSLAVGNPSPQVLVGLGHLPAMNTGAFYKLVDPARFESFTDDQAVSADTLTAFFTENPIEANGDAFWDALVVAGGPLLGLSTIAEGVAKALADLSDFLKAVGVPLESVKYTFETDENGVPTTLVKSKAVTDVKLSTAAMEMISYGALNPNSFKNEDGTWNNDAFLQAYADLTLSSDQLVTPVTQDEGEVAQPIAQPGKSSDGSACLVQVSSVVDYTGFTVSDRATFDFTDVAWADYYNNSGTFNLSVPNPYTEASITEVTPLYYADGTLSDATKVPVQIMDAKGTIGDSDGNVLYTTNSGRNPLMARENADKRAAATVDYLANIVNAIQGSTVSTLLDAVKLFADPAVRVEFLTFVTKLRDDFSGTLGTLNAGVPAIAPYTMAIQSVLEAMPSMTEKVTINGEEKDAFDFTAFLNHIGQNLTIRGVLDTPLGVTFEEINWNNLSADMGRADTLLVTLNYVINNVFNNETNLAAIKAILPTDIANYLDILAGQTPDGLLSLANMLLAPMVYPEYSDADTGIRVNASVAASAALKVAALTSGEAYDQAVNALKDGVDGYVKSVIYNISFESNGVTVQPNGRIQVTIPAPEGFDLSKVEVYRVEADGSVTKMDAKVITGDGVQYIQFETDKLGSFGIVEVNHVVDNTTTEPTTTVPGEQDGTDNGNVSTGDAALAVVAFTGVAAAAAFVLLRKKK